MKARSFHSEALHSDLFTRQTQLLLYEKSQSTIDIISPTRCPGRAFRLWLGTVNLDARIGAVSPK
jgi:hypothetical protein